MKQYTFHVSGTHCPSCKILIEETLIEQDGIKQAFVNLKQKTVVIECDNNKNSEDLVCTLSEKIESYGYRLAQEKLEEKSKQDGTIWQAIPLGLIVLVLFFLLQKSGILNFGFWGKITPITSFLIGLIASVSSCLAVVGWLVLSLSATVGRDTLSDKKTFTLFHVGRILGFAFLGGVLWALWHAIGINPTFTTILGLLTSVVMILLGLNLVWVFSQSKITLPPAIFQLFKKVEYTRFTPVIIGLGTFFLPCGFTQSMQIAALSSGSFFSGWLIMLAFALGTFPVLAFLSFGLAWFAQSRHAPLFFKSAGIVVIGLGLFALLSGLASIGLIDPVINL